jgi:5'-3' exonuclease
VKVHLVDGTYELFRAYYGGTPSQNAKGMEVGATRTLVASMLVLLRDPDATHVGIAFDHVIESFRNDLFDGYKTGEGIDPLLFGQFGLAEVACEALGLVVWPMIEFEADDAMASAAALAEADARVEQVLLCTPDKDMAQCVNGTRVVMLDRMRRTLMDEPRVVEKFGVSPASIPDYLALVGDTADGIPGITGWGARSAGAVLAVYHHVENIPDDPATWKVTVRGAARLARALNEGRTDALLYRKLATLRRDAPLGVDVDGLKWKGQDPEKLGALAEELGDATLVERVNAFTASKTTP